MEHLAFERTGPVGILKINRPDSLNALSRALLEELREFLGEQRSQRMRALILTGAGEKAFVAGADIKEMQGLSPTEMLEFTHLGQHVTQLLQDTPIVTIAAVNGYCLGGGLELALGCDFIYASENARFALPEVSLGLIPGFGGTQRLAHAVGTRMAKELVMTGRHIKSDEALRIGIINRICTSENLISECEETAKEICKNSFFAVLQSKRAAHAARTLTIDQGLELERNMCAVTFGTPDRLEGMTAFVEKREPAFV